MPWRREWQPTPVFLPGESQGQRSLEGYIPWSCKELDRTERLTLSLCLGNHQRWFGAHAKLPVTRSPACSFAGAAVETGTPLCARVSALIEPADFRRVLRPTRITGLQRRRVEGPTSAPPPESWGLQLTLSGAGSHFSWVHSRGQLC